VGNLYQPIKPDVQSTGYEQAIDYLRPGGALLAVGLPGKAQIGASVFWTVVKSINIIGSYVGCASTFFGFIQSD
jgi:propanol-preferring alcohol dehydrogenase